MAPLIRARTSFEQRLAHYLAEDDRVLAVSRELASKCLRYLHIRVAEHCSSSRGRAANLTSLLARIMRPVAYPFAGRPLNLRGCYAFLSGRGNLRELQGTFWLFMAHLLAEDLVGPEHMPAARRWLMDAGFDLGAVDEWVAAALHYKSAQLGLPATLRDLSPNDDLCLMKWHPVRVLQNQTRERFSTLHETTRPWSLMSRREFVQQGGKFSSTENQTFSPLGKDRVPWMDPSRFMRPNETNPLIMRVHAHGFPTRTGISGVAMHIMHFGTIAGVRDIGALQLGAVGYLLSIGAHSFAEVLLGFSNDLERDSARISYQALTACDWAKVALHCGTIPYAEGQT